MRLRQPSWRRRDRVRKDDTRLIALIVLFAVVVLMMILASRPDTWSSIYPRENPPATEDPPRNGSNPEPPRAQTRDGGRTLMLIGLTAAATAYFAWRITTIGRKLRRSRRLGESKSRFARITGRPGPSGAESSELETDEPVPISEDDVQRQPPQQSEPGTA